MRWLILQHLKLDFTAGAAPKANFWLIHMTSPWRAELRVQLRECVCALVPLPWEAQNQRCCTTILFEIQANHHCNFKYLVTVALKADKSPTYIIQ